jgi:hypothetical protein
MWLTPFLRTGVAGLAVVIALVTPGGGDALKDTARIDPIYTFEFRTQADAALAEWALSRFEQAGLSLPPLVIAFHDDLEPCEGNFGYYRAGARARIDICGFNADRFLVTPKKTLLHELAHAWTRHTLTPTTRESFLDFRGLRAWNDDDLPWAEQGSEQAAEIIAWALMDQEVSMGNMSDTQPSTLARAYQLLTSNQPLTQAFAAKG